MRRRHGQRGIHGQRGVRVVRRADVFDNVLLDLEDCVIDHRVPAKKVREGQRRSETCARRSERVGERSEAEKVASDEMALEVAASPAAIAELRHVGDRVAN